MMDWLELLGKIPFILSGIGFAFTLLLGAFGIIYLSIRKIKDLINARR